jgi:hypothetical protein
MTINSISSPSSSSASSRSAVARSRLQVPEASKPPPISGYPPSPVLPPQEPTGTELSQICKASLRRTQPKYPGSKEALSMLTLRSVFTTPMPRHHVEPRAVDGALVVLDRATSERFVVYSPRFVFQFRAGHHAGLWYLRPARDLGATPRSTGYRTARAAVEALRDGVWGLTGAKTHAHRRGNNCRADWS